MTYPNIEQVLVRGGVLKGPSHSYDNPKPGDLGLGRTKSGESLMEVRRGADVQIAPLTWA